MTIDEESLIRIYGTNIYGAFITRNTRKCVICNYKIHPGEPYLEVSKKKNICFRHSEKALDFRKIFFQTQIHMGEEWRKILKNFRETDFGKRTYALDELSK